MKKKEISAKDPQKHRTNFKVKSHSNYQNSFWSDKKTKVTITPYFPEIPRQVIDIYCSETVLDPFCGSGTTLKEGLKMGKIVVGIEIDKNIAKQCFKALIKTTLKK